MASLAGIRPVRVGDVTLRYLSYKSGASRLTSPRLIAVPTERFDGFHSNLESGVAEPAPDREHPDRVVQVILLAFAAFFYATGAFFWFVTDTVQTSTRLYIVAAVALLGSLFVLVAVFEV
ncbi:hypothetical protein [Haladaptatus sp. DJG-WS-42]|uniref:hypothetical protein n=1 Tax=Haladaptatus sp. DJG-WS-42 TaxID=3120516 RepID=UPI0030CB74AA